MRILRGLLALVLLRFGPGRKKEEREHRIVPRGSPDRRAENLVLVLLLAATGFAVGFMLAYGIDSTPSRTQLLGITFGLALGCLAAALIVVGQRLVVTEEIEEDYPELEHPDEEEDVAAIIEESGSRFTRKKLLLGTAGAATSALGLAAIVPALSFGPFLDTDPLYNSPWGWGRRLVDKEGKPLRADEIEQESFYTAYPEGKDREDLAAPVVVVRLDPAVLHLPPERAGWAPGGIVAYSKTCTHAACAVALYRKPTFAPVQPRPALVCPCHYSTFDPATGGSVIFGPAGRDLPQLPLMIDPFGELRASGNYSAAPGPSWQGVRGQGAS